MPFTNRIDPYGQLISTSARGHWLGNRGVLHNEKQQVTSPYRSKAWITCRLDLPRYRGEPGQVMLPGNYTELFFLDEATAFSAGHRPCAQCRRDRYDEFKAAWLHANAAAINAPNPPIGLIDDYVHLERIRQGGEKVSHQAAFGELPAGTFIEFKGVPHLIWRQRLLAWSFNGYTATKTKPKADDIVTVLTPASFVRVFANGFHPQVHQSAYF